MLYTMVYVTQYSTMLINRSIINHVEKYLITENIAIIIQ